MKDILFVVGTGRCGTHFINEILKKNKNIYTSHEINKEYEGFHRYQKHYNLKIDETGFINIKREEIETNFQNKNIKISVESSALLSHSISLLNDSFDCKFMHITRSLERVVSSFYAKGLYKENYKSKKPNQIIGLKKTPLFYHNFSRITPNDDESFKIWSSKTRIGKISWYCSELIRVISKDLENIRSDKVFKIKIEDFNYSKFIEFMDFINIENVLTNKEFDKIQLRKPANRKVIHKYSDWTNQEKKDFEFYLGATMEKLNYNINF